MNSLAKHPRALVALTAALAGSHGVMAGLHGIGRAVPAIRPVGDGLWHTASLMADAPYWVGLHGLAAAGLIISMATHRLRSLAAFWSAFVWVIWCVLILIWSARTTPPVSLTAPIVILILAVPIARVVAAAWVVMETKTETE